MDDQHLHCPCCGYDLTGLTESRCPECGTGFDRDVLRRCRQTDVQSMSQRGFYLRLIYFPAWYSLLILIGMSRDSLAFMMLALAVAIAVLIFGFGAQAIHLARWMEVRDSLQKGPLASAGERRMAIVGRSIALYLAQFLIGWCLSAGSMAIYSAFGGRIVELH